MVEYKKSSKSLSFSVSLLLDKTNVDEVLNVIKNKIDAEIHA